ncbi:hypothetical protein HY483_00330 [Candidatus Woesearchaeota archaeon]|nr:hypothetical protein [Candidatus Woesearchaeota archaeon]
MVESKENKEQRLASKQSDRNTFTTVLLDKVGSSKPYKELRAARYCYPCCDTAYSASRVQEDGLLQVPTYAYFHGCSLADYIDFWSLSDPVLTHNNDTLGERLTLHVDKDYNGVPKGEWAVDVQGGGLIMPRPKLLINTLKPNGLEDDKIHLSGEVLITPEDKDLLLGERQVYRWNGKKLETIPVEYFFTSFAEFDDVSETPEFQKSLRELSAVYAVLRPASETVGAHEGYRPISEQFKNPSLIIPAGSRSRLRRMLTKVDELLTKDEEVVYQLKSTEKRYWRPRVGRGINSHDVTKFAFFECIRNGYPPKNVDKGSFYTLKGFCYPRDYQNGFGGLQVSQGNWALFLTNCYRPFYSSGNSGGIAPEALDQWRELLAHENEGLEKKV